MARNRYIKAQKSVSLRSSSAGSKKDFIAPESRIPKIGNITPRTPAAIEPSSSAGISGLLREARRRSGTSVGGGGGGSEPGVYGSTGAVSITPNPVGRPNRSENEWRLLLPDPDEHRLMDRNKENRWLGCLPDSSINSGLS